MSVMKSAQFEDWVEEVGVSEAAKRISDTFDGEAKNVSYQLIQYWVRNGIPPKHVLKVQSVTEIGCHELRPDIYPLDAA